MAKRTFQLNKLVRDKIVELSLADGQSVNFKILNDADYVIALKQKIIEEAQELTKTDTAQIEELADILEAIDCLIAALGCSKSDILDVQLKKANKKGSFMKRHYIETVSAEGEWADYYASSPDKYPMVK